MLLSGFMIVRLINFLKKRVGSLIAVFSTCLNLSVWGCSIYIKLGELKKSLIRYLEDEIGLTRCNQILYGNKIFNKY